MIPLELGRTRLFFWRMPFAFGVILSRKMLTSCDFLADEGNSTSWNSRMRRRSATLSVVGSKFGCRYSSSASILFILVLVDRRPGAVCFDTFILGHVMGGYVTLDGGQTAWLIDWPSVTHPPLAALGCRKPTRHKF